MDEGTGKNLRVIFTVQTFVERGGIAAGESAARLDCRSRSGAVSTTTSTFSAARKMQKIVYYAAANVGPLTQTKNWRTAPTIPVTTFYQERNDRTLVVGL